MFSPYYAWARRGGAAAEPENFCTVNVALLGPRGGRWAMTERGRNALSRTANSYRLGNTRLGWTGEALDIWIDERTLPAWSPLRGLVRVWPQALTRHTEILDGAGLHRWSPIAPSARVEVDMRDPALRWTGTGYLDSNDGDGPLEETFSEWTWSRTALRDGTAILYDARHRAGTERNLALRIDHAGRVAPIASPPRAALPRTFWRIARETRADPPDAAHVTRTLLDAPFYARSEIRTRILGEDAPAMHESLSLDRFRVPAVQAMLPFRMPRLG